MESLIKTLPAILTAAGPSAEVAQAACFAAWKYDVDAAQGKISVLTSPEVPLAVQTCTDLSTHCTDFETACLGLGKACDDYATQVDEHRDEIVGILKELLAWTVVDQVSGAILSFFTAGAAEVAAQLAEAGIIARYAAKIISVLKKLIEWAKICVEAIKTALVAIKDALLWLPRLLKAKVMTAVAKVGARAAAAEREALIKELETLGIKHNPDDIVAIFRGPDGKIVFLENGSASAGLRHVEAHAGEFASAGIPKDKIPDFLQRAIQDGEIVGYQGKGTGRPIYEVVYNGVTQRVAITTGDNGYIVGANMKSVP